MLPVPTTQPNMDRRTPIEELNWPYNGPASISNKDTGHVTFPPSSPLELCTPSTAFVPRHIVFADFTTTPWLLGSL